MAIDGKYGRVTLEHGTIGENEPVIVFRAQDVTTPKLLAHYLMLCAKAGSPRRHMNLILDTMEAFARWQAVNLTKVPDSETSRAWME